jgi:hypothetical protein
MFYHAAVFGIVVALSGVSLPVESLLAQSPTPETQATPAAPLPAPPANCQALPVVGGEGSEVSKEVSPPTIPIPLPVPAGIDVRNNWNTDWAIAGGQTYRSYLVTFMPRSTGKYNIEMFMKYSDNTAEKFYNERGIRLTAEQPFTATARPRPGTQPYQINVMVGGADIIGRHYTVAVAGCR